MTEKSTWNAVKFDIEQRFGDQEENLKRFKEAQNLIEQKTYYLEELKIINKKLRKLGVKQKVTNNVLFTRSVGKI